MESIGACLMGSLIRRDFTSLTLMNDKETVTDLEKTFDIQPGFFKKTKRYSLPNVSFLKNIKWVNR